MFLENPILSEIVLASDRYHLLDILSTDLPLKLTIPKIDENVFWRRCYIQRWPQSLPHEVQDIEISEIVHCHDVRKYSNVFSARNSVIGPSSRIPTPLKRRRRITGKKSWKDCYIEMHIREYLENLKPENYDAEKVRYQVFLTYKYINTGNNIIRDHKILRGIKILTRNLNI